MGGRSHGGYTLYMSFVNVPVHDIQFQAVAN